MDMKTTAIASAIALALSSTAFAAEQTIPEIPGDALTVTKSTDVGTKGGAYWQNAAIGDNLQGNIHYIGDATESPTGNSNALALVAGAQMDVVNNANIWVTNNGTQSIQALDLGTAANGSTIINNGNIYLDGGNTLSTRTIGISVNSTAQIANNGQIIAKHATAMKISTGSQGATASNSGTITVSDGGSGLYYDDNSSKTGFGNNLNNTGTIYSDADSTAIYTGFSSQNTIITNTGNVVAEGTAINIMGSNNTLHLVNDSHVEGTVTMWRNNRLTVKNVKDEELELKTVGGTLGTSRLTNSDITFTSDSNVSFGDLIADNATVETAAGAQVNIDHLRGNNAQESQNPQPAQITFAINELNQVSISSAEETATINTDIVNGELTDKFITGNLTEEEIVAGSAIGDLENASSSNNGRILMKGGLLSGDTVLDDPNKDGNYQVVSSQENGFTTANMDLAKLNGIAWRNELTSLTDRMSTLRTAPEFAGVWARYKGGEWDGDSINQQFNGVEVGVDKAFGQNFVLGLAASYIEGDGDLDNGSADTENYSGAAYLSYYNSGWFVDVMGKLGKIETDFDLTYNGLKDSGDHTMSGYVFGVETGYRFNFNNFYVEPQVQLTYSYLGSKEFTTDNRTVDFETLESLVGRVGFMSGYDFSDIGSAYLRASYYHDFDGDVDMSVSHNDLTVYESDELDSDWGDVGVGANVNFGPATLFFDVSRTYGGDIDMEWKANAGARLMF